MQGAAYVGLGNDLMAVGQFHEARQAYERGLVIFREVEDHRSIGANLGQLGTLALVQGNLAEARRRYLEALDIFRALGEPQPEAAIWHQLGRVAQETRDWDEAERCYRESLRLKEQQNDLPGVARTYNQLARVAEGAGRLDDAERWYLRAQELKNQVAPQDASTLNNLAGLYLAQGRLDEARQYAESAAAIKETLDLSAEPWTTYSILAEIASKQRRDDESAQWRRKEQESFAAYAGAIYQLPDWAPEFIRAVAAAVQGNADAQATVEDVLSQMVETESWRNLPPIVRLLLAGERDTWALCAELDHYDAFIIRRILAVLSGEAPVPSALPAAPEPPPTQDRNAHIRAQWEPVIQGILAACQGNAEAAAAVTPILDEIGQKDDWRELVAVLRRILAGERDASLLAGLDEVDTLIAGDVLRGLGVALPESDPEPPQQQQGVTLEQLFDLVGSACRPDAQPGLSAALFGLTQQLSSDTNVPPEIRALGKVLTLILTGDRSPNLAGLPEELAEPVRKLLASLS